MGSRVTRTRTPDVQLADTTVAWSATLVQPRRMRATGSQSLICDVQGPVVLDGPVAVRVGSRTLAGEWLGEPGQRRQVRATLSGLPAGRHRVVVSPRVAGEAPDLEASSVRVE